ncbi:hypothetical protein SAMN05216474_0135 [Lishizhenia tianjinensis]|uniref:Uncharacterized protein n=1 Tax=Lishizhenia tianjinensis TaxID=477690 RepID=A0A1I6XER7_9FLAO|nr:hypothetical protein [Lishizhenia tianjinensis]SFT36603.1 hypothetical protein SAMN05216474_0135 [Lishizhenia tianjinensis]
MNYPLNKHLFFWCFLILGSFTLVVITYIWHLETHPYPSYNFIDYISYGLYDILNFPFQFIYQKLISMELLSPSISWFFIGTLLNNILYAFFIERLAKLIELLKN